MELSFSSSFFLCLALAFLTRLLILKLLSSPTQHHPSLPPTPPSLPILGHLHFLTNSLHRTLLRLSYHYGPIFLLRFGSRPVLVVSSLPLFEECFTKNDLAFANRPHFPSVKSIFYDYTTLCTAPHGPHWSNLRRIATVDLLSSARLHSFSEIRFDEVRSLIYNLFREFEWESSGKAVELKSRLYGVSYNVMMRMTAGKRCEDSEEARRFKEVVEETTKLVGASNLSDFLPALRWIDFGGVKSRLRWVNEKKEVMLQRLIDEGKKMIMEGRGEISEKKKSMLEVLLDLQQGAPNFYSDEMIKAMIVTLFFGGTETTTATMEWAMALLINHQESLRTARDEIDLAVGHNRLLQEQDLQNLPYLRAVIRETLRMYPPAPLLVPRESTQECTVGGYYIPRGAVVFVNAWSIHRDPDLWDNPNEFRPERFLEGEGGDFKILPFGAGRRRCPGEGLAMRMIESVLGSLIQCFEWDRIGEELVDMEDTGGLTFHKATPLRVMYRPRQHLIHLFSEY